MPHFTEGRYDRDRLQRNRMTIIGLVLFGLCACMLGGILTSWPTDAVVGTSATVLIFGVFSWWMFGSRKSGPVTLNQESIARFKQTYWHGR